MGNDMDGGNGDSSSFNKTNGKMKNSPDKIDHRYELYSSFRLKNTRTNNDIYCMAHRTIQQWQRKMRVHTSIESIVKRSIFLRSGFLLPLCNENLIRLLDVKKPQRKLCVCVPVRFSIHPLTLHWNKSSGRRRKNTFLLKIVWLLFVVILVCLNQIINVSNWVARWVQRMEERKIKAFCVHLSVFFFSCDESTFAKQNTNVKRTSVWAR